jgi:hypothetical protein
MSNIEKVETIPLNGTKKGVIMVSKIDEPYGDKTDSVASVGISLTGNKDEIDWKIHIPLTNIQNVIDALNKIKQ